MVYLSSSSSHYPNKVVPAFLVIIYAIQAVLSGSELFLLVVMQNIKMKRNHITMCQRSLLRAATTRMDSVLPRRTIFTYNDVR